VRTSYASRRSDSGDEWEPATGSSRQSIADDHHHGLVTERAFNTSLSDWHAAARLDVPLAAQQRAPAPTHRTGGHQAAPAAAPAPSSMQQLARPREADGHAPRLAAGARQAAAAAHDVGVSTDEGCDSPVVDSLAPSPAGSPEPPVAAPAAAPQPQPAAPGEERPPSPEPAAAPGPAHQEVPSSSSGHPEAGATDPAHAAGEEAGPAPTGLAGIR
jgi:hypothetical protein